ncbi:taste receptor type 2 member 10-like [Pelobates fuscus]|uniref:taste receptor type 2 member 10-like n=1 Tax=Pelobates fuscus TaxID=191477 RepID=UPI002FE48243
MRSLSCIAVLAVEMIALALSVSGNMFIIVTNLLAWTKNKTFNLSDQLITWISVSNVFFVLLRLISNLIYEKVNQAFYIMLHLALIFCNLWFCAWLTTYFCLKINNLCNRFYISLQRRLYKIFPWIPIPSVLVALLVSLPVALFRPEKILPSKADNDSVSHILTYSSNFIVSFLIYGTFSTLAFFFSGYSIMNIVMSLYRHIKNMQGNIRGFRGSNVEVHVRAVKTVISVLSFNVILFTVNAVTVFYIDDMSILYYSSISTSFIHFLCSVILINGNCNLSKSLRTLRNSVCCLCTRYSSK